MSDDSLDFTVLFSESLKWNKSFFTLICWISPVWNRVSQLIYPAVWLTFYRGLPLTGSELHGNLCFFIFYKPGSFFINALSLTNNLYSGMKNKLSLGLSDTKKNLKRIGVSSILAATIIGHFSGILCIHSSSISAYSWRLKDNTLFSESISDVKSLSIYYSSSTGESRVHHWEWKGSGRYSDADYM